MVSEKETYLGDGLYVSSDGHQIRLRAPREGGAHHLVFMERFVLDAFLAYLKDENIIRKD